MKRPKKDVGAIYHKGSAGFRVWAPFASAVAVTGSFNNWSKVPLESENDGYWFVEIKDIPAGSEYKFVVCSGQNEMYKNDPRSLQVTTNSGNSILVDKTFDWENDAFSAIPWNKQIFYELHIGTFNRVDPSTPGTFEDAINKLDYLVELGVNMVELMPISSMSNDRGWGYATDYIYAVESLYGGRHQFMNFVKQAHKRGIGVVLDVVYNHFGPDNNLDLWQFDGWGQDGKGGIYFYNDWRSQTPWGETRPDFGRTEVRQFIVDNARMWMNDCHLDGLRVDSTIFIRNVRGHNNDPDNDLGDGWWTLQQVNAASRRINSSAIMIAEDVSGNDYITKDTGAGGAGFGVQWEVSYPHILRGALNPAEDYYRNILGVCDALSKRYNGDAFQRVVYSDSHDSAANGGSRLNEEISPGNPTSIYARQRSLIAAAIVFSTPGIPMLFQGQEFLEGGSFNDWQELKWENVKKFKGIVEAHRHLIALRKNNYLNTVGLCGQSINIMDLNDANKVMSYHRWDRGGPGDDVLVVINFSAQVFKDYWLNFPKDGIWRVRFNSAWKGYSPDFKNLDPGEPNVAYGRGSLNLPAYSAIILSQDPS